LVWQSPLPPSPSRSYLSDLRVLDGDTIEAHGAVYRLVGFDAPETGYRAQCAGERDRGVFARRGGLRLSLMATSTLSASRAHAGLALKTRGSAIMGAGAARRGFEAATLATY
jgi:hypothetical protein